MKRMHVHVGVEDLNQSIGFYSALFGVSPDKVKDDYARWLLEDPRLNFAISTNADQQGISHLGLQVETATELDEVRDRLKSADETLFDEGEVTCCYANSDKSWVKDPSDVSWEAFQTVSDADEFLVPAPSENPISSGQCC